jgi:hypothetical protein
MRTATDPVSKMLYSLEYWKTCQFQNQSNLINFILENSTLYIYKNRCDYEISDNFSTDTAIFFETGYGTNVIEFALL